MHNTLRLLQPIPLLQLTALLQAIQLVDILQPLMAGRAMATAQDHPTSCAKLSERARLVTVAPTLSPMPNGKPLSSASGTAESASSAIAFRRTDYWLKPRRNARRARPAIEGIREELAAAVKKGPARPGLSFTLCVSAGTEPGGKCGVGQLVMARRLLVRCGKPRPVRDLAKRVGALIPLTHDQPPTMRD
jgi:hypothetical protein